MTSKNHLWHAMATAAAILAAACSRESHAQPVTAEPTTDAAIAAVIETEMPRTLSLTGSLVANQESDVAADGAGKVLSTHVERGELVERGATLARLDVRAAALGVADARAQLEAARSRAASDEVECNRSRHLLAQGAITRAEHDRDTARCDASRWSVTAAEARTRLAAKAVGDGVVRAPFAGIIAERGVSAGEYVRADTRIATLLEVDPLRLELTVPESDLGAVTQGQVVTFRVPAFPDEDFHGAIRYVGPALRRASRDLVVEAVVENADRRLRPGMFAVARVELGLARVAAVPRSAIRTEGTTKRVFAVTNGRLEERLIQVGPEQGDLVAVVAGVRAGERVVRTVTAQIHEGLRVQ